MGSEKEGEFENDLFRAFFESLGEDGEKGFVSMVDPVRYAAAEDSARRTEEKIRRMIEADGGAAKYRSGMLMPTNETMFLRVDFAGNIPAVTVADALSAVEELTEGATAVIYPSENGELTVIFFFHSVAHPVGDAPFYGTLRDRTAEIEREAKEMYDDPWEREAREAVIWEAGDDPDFLDLRYGAAETVYTFNRNDKLFNGEGSFGAEYRFSDGEDGPYFEIVIPEEGATFFGSDLIRCLGAFSEDALLTATVGTDDYDGSSVIRLRVTAM